MPESPSEFMVLYTKIEILGEFNNAPRGFINQTTWDAELHEHVPLLALDRTEWADSFVPYIKSGPDRWIDIVLNNFDDRGHPFHLVRRSWHCLSHCTDVGVSSTEMISSFCLSMKQESEVMTRHIILLTPRKHQLVVHSIP